MAAKKRAASAKGVTAAGLRGMSIALDRAQETGAMEAWTEVGRRLVQLLRASVGADDVERVLRAHGGVFDPEGYLEPLPEAVDVLFERVVAMADPQEAGRILGWISRTCATPLVMVGPPGHPELEPYREKAREAVEAHIGEIREWLNDDTAERRTAAAHLLSLSTSDEKDAETLLAMARRDPQPVPAATALLGAALMGRRLRRTKDECASLAQLRLGDGYPLVRICAATAMAFADFTLPADAVQVLAEHATSPTSLPTEWGMHTSSPTAVRSDWIALELLTWVRTSAPEFAVDALESIPLGNEETEFSELVLSAYMHMAIEAKGGPVDALRLAASELDDLARRALTTVASGRFHAGWRELSPDEIGALLAERDPEWRPMKVELEGRTRRLHFNALMAGVVLDGWPAGPIREALTGALDADTLARLVALPTATSATLGRRITTPIQERRQQQFAFETLLALEKHGYDLDALLREASVPGSRFLVSGIVLLIFHKYPRSIPEGLRKFVEGAVSWAVSSEPLLGSMQALPHQEILLILHGANVGAPGAWSIWGLGLHDESVLHRLVADAIGATGQAHRTEVFEVLRHGDAEVATLLKTITVTPYEQASAQFVAEVVNAIHARLA